MPHPPNEKYLPMYNLQQQYIEQYLHDAVTALRSRRHALAERACRHPTRPRMAFDRHRLARRQLPPRGGYVLAADGARSPIRSQLGLRMKGDNYEGRYVIADIRMDHDFPTERRAFFERAAIPAARC